VCSQKRISDAPGARIDGKGGFEQIFNVVVRCWLRRNSPGACRSAP
jgi:hypothetical protein